MIRRLLIALATTLAVSACGVKSDLLMPNGKATPKNQHDPSRPPQPIGR
ncbi:MAG: LPS translocon maturation chaperone LptM [Rhizomicrobium sp.]